MTDCRNCRRDTELFLCQLCTKELGALLGDLPFLLDQLEITVIRQDRLSTGVIGRSSDNPSPINVGAMELARNLRGQLGTIIRDLCEVRGQQPPLKAWSNSTMAEWLGGNISAISCSESAGQVYREMRTGTDAVLAVINRFSRMYCGPCTSVAGHSQSGEDVECGHDLYADRDNPEDIQCPECDRWINPREQLMVHFKRRDLMGETELIDAMRTVGEPVTEAVLDKWLRTNQLTVRGYMHRGRILAKPFSKRDFRIFSLSQARELRARNNEGVA
jgi:hypothetical protein